MGRQNNVGWGTIIGGIAQLALAGGTAFVVYQARENFIDQLLSLSTEDALRRILQSVPEMDEQTWNLIEQGLYARAQQSDRANRFLDFATDVRNVCISVEQLLTRSASHAKLIVEGSVQDMDDATWNVFVYVLNLHGQTNMTARMLLSHAQQTRNAPLIAEALFRDGLRAALADYVITAQEGMELEKLRQKLHISPETARRLLQDVRQETTASNLIAAPHINTRGKK